MKLNREQFFELRCVDMETKMARIEAAAMIRAADGNMNEVKKRLGLEGRRLVSFDTSALTITVA